MRIILLAMTCPIVLINKIKIIGTVCKRKVCIIILLYVSYLLWVYR